MTCHSLMQFASLAGEGQETAHNMADDMAWLLFIFSFFEFSFFISFLLSTPKLPLTYEGRLRIYTVCFDVKYTIHNMAVHAVTEMKTAKTN